MQLRPGSYGSASRTRAPAPRTLSWLILLLFLLLMRLLLQLLLMLLTLRLSRLLQGACRVGWTVCADMPVCGGCPA